MLNQDRLLGVTIHLMDEDFDSGAILAQVSIRNHQKTYLATLDVLFSEGQELLESVLSDSTQFTPVEQDCSERTYFSSPSRADVKEFLCKGLKL